MTQTKARSLKEATVNTIVGILVTFTIGPICYWICNIPLSWKQNIGMTTLFTLLSLLRGYIIRRIFNKHDK